jgi:hypothetical protein
MEVFNGFKLENHRTKWEFSSGLALIFWASVEFDDPTGKFVIERRIKTMIQSVQNKASKSSKTRACPKILYPDLFHCDVWWFLMFPHVRVFRPLKKVTGDVIGYSAAIHACSLVCGPWPGPGAEKTCDQRSRVPGLPGLSWVRPVK